MTREKMKEIEGKIYEAVRSKWGYGDEAEEIVDGVGEAMDAWFDTKEGEEIKVKGVSMKYFRVNALFIEGEYKEYPVMSDGEIEEDNVANDDRTHQWFIGYEVSECGEDGVVENVKKYYVDRGRPGATPDDLLEQIKKDHPAGEWQNNEW